MHEVLKVSLEATGAGPAQIHVADVSGKTMLTEFIKLQRGFNQYQANLHKLAPGTYYLVTTRDNSRKTFPFIKFKL